MKSRKKVELPKKNNVEILSEDQRKYIAYRHAFGLQFTPKFWQKHYMQIWIIVWWLGKLSLGVFLLAIFIIFVALLLGIQ
jgi:hypothetical protein